MAAFKCSFFTLIHFGSFKPVSGTFLHPGLAFFKKNYSIWNLKFMPAITPSRGFKVTCSISVARNSWLKTLNCPNNILVSFCSKNQTMFI